MLNTQIHVKIYPLWCFTPAVDIPSQQQLPLYNTHFVGLPQMLLKRGNTVQKTITSIKNEPTRPSGPSLAADPKSASFT